jgi:ketosteroid isomerase-like protein
VVQQLGLTICPGVASAGEIPLMDDGLIFYRGPCIYLPGGPVDRRRKTRERHISMNIGISRKLYGDFQQANVGAIQSVCTEDTVWQIPGAPALPYAGRHRGKAAVGGFFAALGASLTITEFTPESYTQDGDWVWVAGHYAGHNPAGQGHFHSAWVHRWRLTDGKVSELHDYFDTLTAAQSIGRI